VLDAKPTFDMTALGGLLLRSESVASSKIERLDVSQRDLARALIGAARPKSIAGRVAANVRALQRAVALAGDAEVTRETFTEIHRVLMEPDEYNAQEAGVIRSEQNWIGGSDYTPRDAMFVPPKPELVPALLDDLAAFMSRSDMAAVVQAAVAHAQFETIHPFIDGNGRTGRALVHLLFQRRALVTQTVVPVSMVLLADPGSYFDGLELYRRGALDEWVRMFAAAAALGATSATQLGEQLREIADDWKTAARPRAGSAVKKLLDGLARQPVVDIDQVAKLCPGIATTNLHRAVNRLVEAGILAPITTGKRNQVWAATDIIDLLERFEKDVIGRRKPPLIAP
jgi:Fic family protein